MNKHTRLFLLIIVIFQLGCNKSINNQHCDYKIKSLVDFYSHEDSLIYREQEYVYDHLRSYPEIITLKNKFGDSIYEIYYYSFNGGIGSHDYSYGILTQDTGCYISINDHNSKKQQVKSLDSAEVNIFKLETKSELYSNRFILQSCYSYGHRNCLMIKHGGKILFCYLFFIESDLPVEFMFLKHFLKLIGAC